MHRYVLSTMTLCSLLLAASLPTAAENKPVNLILSPPEGVKASKAFVAFPHAQHEAAKLDCVTCHHTWDQKSEVRQCSTSGCHDQPGKKGATSFYAAFHSKKSDASCLGCHKKMKKAGNKAVPVSCKSCHPKQ